VGGRGVGRVESDGRWVNDALRHRRPSFVHNWPDRWLQQPLPYNEPCRCTMG